ncbi:MAG: carbohydrate-binding protein [Methanospirillum sp.]
MDTATARRVVRATVLACAAVLLAASGAGAARGEVVVPGMIEAEAFDPGGEGVGYHDTTPGNGFGACRTAEDVDIAALPGGGYAVADVEDGEWLDYTIDGLANPPGGYPYPVLFYVASDRDGRSIQVAVDGTVVRNVSVPNTGSLRTFSPVMTQFGLPLRGPPSEGNRTTVRVRFCGDGQSLDRIVFRDDAPTVWGDQWMTPPFSINVTNGTAPLTVQFTDGSGQWTYGWHWYFGDGMFSDERNPVHTFASPGNYTVVQRVDEEDHWMENYPGVGVHILEPRSGAGALIVVRPPVIAVPPGPALPLDGDGDGRYEDVNGNGRGDFGDVVLFFNRLSWIAANEPSTEFDYTGNGRIDFADVVWLFDRL